jgi:hypothetical protein
MVTPLPCAGCDGKICGTRAGKWYKTGECILGAVGVLLCRVVGQSRAADYCS